MTVDEVPTLARELMQKYGIWELGWRFQWDSARRRAGCCKYRYKQITLSRHYVTLNIESRLGDIIDTILHEIAHALAPKHNHDDVWKMRCVEIGANPKRCYDTAIVAMPKGRLVASCPSCGRKFRRHKQIKRRAFAYCPSCGPERGRLTFREEGLLGQNSIPEFEE